MGGAYYLRRELVVQKLARLGTPVRADWGVGKLRKLLEKRTDFVRECQSSLTGSVWDIIIHTDGFWSAASDFRFLCLLCRTAKLFAWSLPVNNIAWKAISGNLPPLDKKTLQKIYMVPRFFLHNCPDISPLEALGLSYAVYGSARGICYRRESLRITSERRKRKKHQTGPQAAIL